MHNKAAELWRLLCFLNGGWPPSWILAEVKFGCISVSGTSALVSEPNCMWILAIPTDIRPLKWTFKICRHLGFFPNWNFKSAQVAACLCLPPHQICCRYVNGRPSYGDLFVFKMAVAAILDFCGSKIWRYLCFRDVGCSLWAKFCANMCNCDRFMAVKWIFKMAAAAILDFSEVKFDVTGSHVRLVSTSTSNLVKISQRASELWWFMCFKNGGQPPCWIFAEVKFGGIFVSWMLVLVLSQILCEYMHFWPSYGCLNEFSKWRPPPSWISRKSNLTSPEVAGRPYLPPHQIWWRYLNGHPSYGDFCI